jgi:hypothetical protein
MPIALDQLNYNVPRACHQFVHREASLMNPRRGLTSLYGIKCRIELLLMNLTSIPNCLMKTLRLASLFIGG